MGEWLLAGGGVVVDSLWVRSPLHNHGPNTGAVQMGESMTALAMPLDTANSLPLIFISCDPTRDQNPVTARARIRGKPEWDPTKGALLLPN